MVFLILAIRIAETISTRDKIPSRNPSTMSCGRGPLKSTESHAMMEEGKTMEERRSIEERRKTSAKTEVAISTGEKP